MITEIRLDGFKCFIEKEIPLRPLTLLAGLNSSGKSSVIQSILMAERAYKGASPMLKDHGTIKEVTNPNSSEFEITLNDDKGNNFTVRSSSEAILIKNDKSFIMPKISYVEAGRYGSMPSIEVDNDSTEIGSKGENLIKCIDYYADQEIKKELRHSNSQGDTLLFNIKGWLSIISPSVNFEYEQPRLLDQSISIFDSHRATNVGFGLSYTLPIIAVLLRASISSDSLVLIENPEAHLHPKGQTEMGKFIALCADCGVNVIVETHSDHVFDGIRLYIKEHPAFANKFLAYWFEQDNLKSDTKIECITLDENARFETIVPSGFFDQFEINARNLI